MAIEASKINALNNPDEAASHVGYYLLGKGLKKMHHQAKVKLPVIDVCRSIAVSFPLVVYMGLMVMLTMLFTSSLTAKANSDGLHGWQLAALIIISFFLLPANWLCQ